MTRRLDWKWIGIGIVIMVALNIIAGLILGFVLKPQLQDATNVESINLSGGQVALAAALNFLAFVIGGYIVGIKAVRVYHAGDTDAIPEMKGLKPDVALLPVSGTYVMTAEEAAQAVKMVEPKVAIPMHYGLIVGTEQDAQKFKQLAIVEVQILKPE